MEHKSFDGMSCPVALALERVGEWWSILILRDATHGLSRFDQFQKSLGISPNSLTRRLNGLVDAGLLVTDEAAERRGDPRRARHADDDPQFRHPCLPSLARDYGTTRAPSTGCVRRAIPAPRACLYPLPIPPHVTGGALESLSEEPRREHRTKAGAISCHPASAAAGARKRR